MAIPQKSREAIELIGLKELILISKKREAGCFNRKVVKKNILYLNIKAGENKKNRKSGESEKNRTDRINRVNREVTVFKKGGKTELIKLKKLDILMRNIFRSEL